MGQSDAAAEVMGNDSCSCFDAVVLDGKAVGLDGFKQVVSKRRDRGDDDWQVPEEPRGTAQAHAT